MADQDRQEKTMCQCHDQYAAGVPRSAAKAAEGAQCHDDLDFERGPTVNDHRCRITSAESGPVWVVRVIGKLDWATEHALADAVAQIPDAPVVIDLTEAQTSSGGTSGLLAVIMRMRHHDQESTVVVTDPVEAEVLRSIGLDEVIPVVRTVQDGIEALRTTANSWDRLAGASSH